MNGQIWLKAAAESGFENFEIYLRRRQERSFSWYDGQLDSFVTSRVTGTALRGVYAGKMVRYALETEGEDSRKGGMPGTMEKVLLSMKEQAGVITSDDGAVLLQPQETQEVASEKKWVRPEAGEIRELLADLEQRILHYDPRIVQVTHLAWEEESAERQILNSCGLHVQDSGGAQILAAGAAAVQDGEVRNDFLAEVVQDLSTLDTHDFVKRLCEKTLGKLGASSVPSGRYRVIFENEAMTALLGAFSDIFSGERISRGLSPLRDKVGEKVFSEQITIIDDPRCQDTVSLYNYDDEGHPTMSKTVVENGVFRTVLHSTASAARMGMKSTGNGFKASWSAPVKVSPMNCRIEPGSKSPEEMCREMYDGLVITELAGLHAGLNHVTGDFSLQCSGYRVREGKRDHSVSLITVAGNFLELMSRVTAVGNDLDWKYHSIAAPSIAFAECAVSGDS